MESMNHVYIVTTKKNTALYVGVTSNLARRIWEHKQGLVNSHSKKYSINKLVYTEEFEDIREAIHREKCIKRWKRDWKIELIEKVNPKWEELSIL